MKRNCSAYWFGLRWKESQEWALPHFHHDFNRGWNATEGKTKQHQHSLNSKKVQDLWPVKILCKLQIILIFEEMLKVKFLFHCFSPLLSLVTLKVKKTIEVEQNRKYIYIFSKTNQNWDKYKKTIVQVSFWLWSKLRYAEICGMIYWYIWKLKDEFNFWLSDHKCHILSLNFFTWKMGIIIMENTCENYRKWHKISAVKYLVWPIK